MGQILQNGERLLLSLWVGAIWSIGYLAVPTLFLSLEDRAVAGMVAGKLLTGVSLIGLGCGSALLSMFWMQCKKPLQEWRVQLLLLMLLLVVLGEFALQPQMAALKAAGLVEGSGAAARFGVIHGLAAIFYLASAIIGVVLLALIGSPPRECLREDE
ncbi:MAG: DUF4149 domain-containing protein [Gammaproteobacteria bacterium]|nr:DUF4149 domain-containing protein [Gammaproteobacteria bacterium]